LLWRRTANLSEISIDPAFIFLIFNLVSTVYGMEKYWICYIFIKRKVFVGYFNFFVTILRAKELNKGKMAMIITFKDVGSCNRKSLKNKKIASRNK
jgi:hypothetical protein